MAGTVVKMEGAEVAREGPERTTINITVRQESGLAYLCKGVAGLAGRKAAAKDAEDAGQAPRAPRPAGGEQKVLGAAQILLGTTCIGLGMILSLALQREYNYYYYYYYHYYYRAVYNGVPFWMGTLFIFSGTSSVVGARRRGYWVHLAAFLNLASFVAGSVAFTLGLTDIGPLSHKPYFVAKLCKHQAEDQGYRSWQLTTSPPYDNERDRERAGRCQEVFWRFVRMWSATQILLLILHVAALAIALFCFGHGLRRLCCSFWGGRQDCVAEDDPDDCPAPKEPGKEQEPA